MASKKLEVLIEYITKEGGLRNAVKQNALLKESIEGLNKTAFKGAKIQEQTTQIYQKKGKVFADVSTTIVDADGKIHKISNTLEYFREQTRKANGQMGAMKDGFRQVKDSMEITSTSSKKLNGVFANIGAEFVKVARRALLTVPAWQAVRFGLDLIGKGVTNTVKQINDLDDAVRRAIIVFDPLLRTASNMKLIEESIVDLAKSTGISTEEIGKSFRELARAGLEVEDTLLANEAATKLITVSEANASTVTRALVIAYNQYGESLTEAAKGQNVFNFSAALFSKISDKAVGSLDDILDAFIKFAPTAKAAGVSFEELSALILTLDKSGFSGGQIGTILQRLFSREATQIEPILQLIKDLGGPGLSIDEKPFVVLTTLFETMATTDRSVTGILKAFFDVFGEKAQKGIGFIKDVEDLKNLITEITGFTSDAGAVVDDLNAKVDLVTGGNKLLLSQIGILSGEIGKNLLQAVTGTDNWNSALEKTRDIFEGLEGLTADIAVNFRELFPNVAELFDKLEKKGVERRKTQALRKDFDDLTKNLAIAGIDTNDLSSISNEQAAQMAKETIEQKKLTEAKKEDVKVTEEKKKSTFSFDKTAKERLNRLHLESVAISELAGNYDKAEKSSAEFSATLDVLRQKLKDPSLSDSFLTDLIQKSPDEIGSFLKSRGFEDDSAGIIDEVTKALEAYLNKEAKLKVANDEKIKREIELKSIQLDRLSALGFTEEEIAQRKLDLLDGIDNADEQVHKRQKERLEAYNKRILEITESIKSSFQSGFEGLFKNELTPSSFASNLGDTFQNQSISSSARIATTAVLGTGIADQFASALEATEQNPIVRSFIEGARQAGAILKNDISAGLSGQTGINTGDVTGQGGLGGLLGGLLGGGFGQKGGKIGPPTQAQAQGQLFGGFANAGITGVLTGLAASKRGGSAGLLGGAGGFLTSAAPLLGALGPIGGLVGAGLTIASFFGGKKKSTESRTEEQLISIAPKIDVSNKKLELINRNLVALKNVMEIYVLPQSAYYSESRNISDTFSLYARRGLA